MEGLCKLDLNQQNILWESEVDESRCSFYFIKYGDNIEIAYKDENGFWWVREKDDVKNIEILKEVVY